MGIGMAIERGFTIGRMRAAYREGWNVTTFILWARNERISYHYQDMLNDWRTVVSNEEKGGKLRFVSADKYPTDAIIQDNYWQYEKEYIYTVKWWEEGKALTEENARYGTLLSDELLTRGEVEEGFIESYYEVEEYKGIVIQKVQGWTVARRVGYLEEEQ